MLPPKLAQVMINLLPKRPHIIYDPFCGNGTILQEALIMRYKIIGSDILKDRAYDTIQNLLWLQEGLDFNISPEKMVFKLDAQKVTGEDLPENPDAIVSEVYLGPPLDTKTSEREIQETTNELGLMYKEFFNNTYKNLPSVECIVLALPFYKLKNKEYHLDIFDQIQKIGYNTISPLEKLKNNRDLLTEYTPARKSVLYSREEQIVGREIIILKRK
jgi:tRNA G10  N-methylase Trm11